MTFLLRKAVFSGIYRSYLYFIPSHDTDNVICKIWVVCENVVGGNYYLISSKKCHEISTSTVMESHGQAPNGVMYNMYIVLFGFFCAWNTISVINVYDIQYAEPIRNVTPFIPER